MFIRDKNKIMPKIISLMAKEIIKISKLVGQNANISKRRKQ
jgi:hypothetical protein